MTRLVKFKEQIHIYKFSYIFHRYAGRLTEKEIIDYVRTAVLNYVGMKYKGKLPVWSVIKVLFFAFFIRNDVKSILEQSKLIPVDDHVECSLSGAFDNLIYDVLDSYGI